MTESRYCKTCDKKAEHRLVRQNAFGDENEGFVSRAFFGVISFGVSEFCSDYAYECLDCGRRRP